jgi:hypothetical protein
MFLLVVVQALDIDVPLMPAGSFIQALSGTASAINVQMLNGSYFS